MPCVINLRGISEEQVQTIKRKVDIMASAIKVPSYVYDHAISWSEPDDDEKYTVRFSCKYTPVVETKEDFTRQMESEYHRYLTLCRMMCMTLIGNELRINGISDIGSAVTVLPSECDWV